MMATDISIKSYKIDNICIENKGFLLECPFNMSFTGTVITTNKRLFNRQILWDYLLNSDILNGKFCYILSHTQTPTHRKSQVWLLKNKTWEQVSDIQKLNDIHARNFFLKEENNLTLMFYWVKINLCINIELLDKLLNTDRFYLIISYDNIANKLDELIQQGWHYHSLRQMQIPQNILQFIYDNHLQGLMTLGRFDDLEKDLLIIQRSRF